MIVSNYAIRFRTAVFVFVAVLILSGATSYLKLPREGAPDITIPFVFVSAVYEGTAPAEMEKLVTIQLEKSLNGVENIKEIRSTTAEGLCSISIEFIAGEDIDQARQRVKDKVDLAKQDLPEDLDEPVVYAFNFSSDFPIFIFALSGLESRASLKALAEDLQSELELLPGVKEAAISGTREREIRVEFDSGRLAAYDMPIGLVMQRIAEENRTISAGNIKIAGDQFQVRVPAEFELASQMRDILLADRGGNPVYLRDIATVEDTFKDVDSISRLNGAPCVSLSIMKRVGENSVSLIRNVQQLVEAFAMPADVQITVVMDESDYVRMMIAELENNIASGFILVVIVLFIFMGWRNSLFVGIAIPLSMLIAFAAMSLMGFTLNMIVLFSLVLAVGMLVDNAIVIVENIYRHRCNGLSRIEAARTGAAEVAWPVVTSTLTTCAAFSPLIFWPDIIGQFMSFMPKTLIVTLSASLFVAIVINPAVCSALITAKGRKRPESAPPREHRLLCMYEAFLRGALRLRVPVVLLAACVFVLTIQVYQRYGKGVELFPETEPRNAVVSVRLPQGAAIERTDAVMRGIEKLLPEYEDIQFFLTTVGEGGQAQLMAPSGSHIGQIHVEFKKAAERERSTTELVGMLRAGIGVIPGAEIKVEKQQEGPPTGAPITIEVSGEDFDTLSELASTITRRIETVPGLVDLQDDFEEALPEVQIRVDRHQAAMLGLSSSEIGSYLRTTIYGVETSKFRSGEEEYDITLRLPEGQRDSLELLERGFIPLASGVSIPLTSVCRISYEGGRGAITRKNQKRVISITGNKEGRGVDKILEDIRLRLKSLQLPRGYSIFYAGDNQDMQESGAFLARAFAVAVGLILVILVWQFNSAVLPLIIISSVVLSIIGVMWGLLICQMRFGVIMTGLGVISLAGIVVNNAIVLVDCIRQRMLDGLSPVEAAVAAGKMRLRPVMLTAVTTILGLIPMAIGYSLEVHDWPPRFIEGAESSAWWAPMAVAVIFGLAVATLLTLILVPVMFSLASSAVACVSGGRSTHTE